VPQRRTCRWLQRIDRVEERVVSATVQNLSPYPVPGGGVGGRRPACRCSTAGREVLETLPRGRGGEVARGWRGWRSRVAGRGTGRAARSLEADRKKHRVAVGGFDGGFFAAAMQTWFSGRLRARDLNEPGPRFPASRACRSLAEPVERWDRIEGVKRWTSVLEARRRSSLANRQSGLAADSAVWEPIHQRRDEETRRCSIAWSRRWRAARRV